MAGSRTYGGPAYYDSHLPVTLYIQVGPSHKNIESQKAEAMRQQAEHGLTDAW